ncbi:hypothetical protein [Vagococcus sp. WN89Y]|uniref:hypothetical protein n=1 Tax=Vagococcus sp. WN89Y TaxID=3457258 RepID=UPI003FCC6417
MRKSSVLAICCLALFPAVPSHAEVVVSSSSDYYSDSLLVYKGTDKSGAQELAVRGDLSIRSLKEVVDKFPEQTRNLSDLQRTVEEQRRENNSLKSSNEALSRKVDDLQRNLDELKRSVSDLSSKIK